MKRDYFVERETLPQGSVLALDEVIDELAFNEQGLIPVITQEASTREVLMMAWMNKAAIEKTLETGKMVYWSRSREQFWLKGETSGHFQVLNPCTSIVMAIASCVWLSKPAPLAIPAANIVFIMKLMHVSVQCLLPVQRPSLTT